MSECPVYGGYTDNIVLVNVKNSNGKTMKLVLSNLAAGRAKDVIIAVKTQKPDITVYKKGQEPEAIIAAFCDGAYNFFNIGDVDYRQVILIEV